MSSKYRELEGAVSVNGDITPITRQPIDQIDSSDWGEMSYAALSEQYEMLNKRMNVAKTMARPDLVKQMQRGMAHLLQVMETKRPKDDGVTLL